MSGARPPRANNQNATSPLSSRFKQFPVLELSNSVANNAHGTGHLNSQTHCMLHHTVKAQKVERARDVLNRRTTLSATSVSGSGALEKTGGLSPNAQEGKACNTAVRSNCESSYTLTRQKLHHEQARGTLAHVAVDRRKALP